MVKQAQTPIIYFEAAGIYSRVIEHFCETNGLCFCRFNLLELHLKFASLRRVKTDQKDAHRIVLTVQENSLRLTVSWPKDYLTLHELSRFYNQFNAFGEIDIRRYLSGIHLGQDHINKRGTSIVRKLLYFTVGNVGCQQHANSSHIVDY